MTPHNDLDANGSTVIDARRRASHVRMVSAASFLPGPPVSTFEVERRIASASPTLRIRHGLLQGLTGIRNRHYLGDCMQASDLAVEAAVRAIDNAGIRAADIELLIWGSASQDLVEPATAHIVAAKLGLDCHVFDVKNACNSFLNAIQVASALLEARAYRTALVVTGESPSRAIRWSVDSNSSFMSSGAGYTMGDAGSAVLLRYEREKEGIFYQDFRAASRHWDVATLPGGGSMHPRGDEWTYFSGDGARLREAFKAIGPGFIDDALKATSTRYEDYAAIFCHQVTVPFLEIFCDATGLPIARLVQTVGELGNIASATMPTQLARAIDNGTVRIGDQIMFIGLAGGLSVGVMLATL